MPTRQECIERAQKQLDKVEVLEGIDLVIVDDKDILRAALQTFIRDLENVKPNKEERHEARRLRRLDRNG
tara:strand:- start:14566 stop:14775 length:210 start_codon:yes stop_codon:yes gene_type:complete